MKYYLKTSLFLTVVVVLMSGCFAPIVPIIKEAQKIREINATVAARCEYIGISRIHTITLKTIRDGYTTRRSAYNMVPNKVYELKGNAYITKNVFRGTSEMEIEFEVYHCDFLKKKSHISPHNKEK